jgi:predicted phosphodiesterase
VKFVNVDLGQHDSIVILPISDLHKGDRNHNPKHIDRIVSDLLNYDNVYGVLIGDLINNALKNSKSDSYKDIMSPKEQRNAIIDKLLPVKHKLLGCTGGNHEDRTDKETDIDVSEDIAKALGIPYDQTGIYYHVKLGTFNNGNRFNYTIYTTHGSGGAGTKGSKANKIYSMRDICLADVYIMGHIHDIITFPDLYYVPDTRHNRIVEQERYFCSSGSSLNWGGYAERLMIKPSKTGFPIVTFDGTKKKCNVTI